MTSLKRKAPLSTPYDNPLVRRVRARREPSEELEEDVAASEDEEVMSEVVSDKEDEEEEASDDRESVSSKTIAKREKNEPDPRSFGEILKAKSKVEKPAKRNGDKKRDTDDPTRSRKSKQKDDTWTNDEALERKAGRKDTRVFGRSNKHAPTEVSSKVPVSRFREVFPDNRPKPRDPRFEPVNGPVDERLIKKRYAFLDDYRDDEMKALKLRIKESKDESTKEKLKRELRSMESQKKAQLRKDREQEVLDRHKKEEKELVKQGKKPFYLKEKEKKNRVLVDEFKGLSGGKLDHAMERRRKKLAARQKKNLPWERRTGRED